MGRSPWRWGRRFAPPNPPAEGSGGGSLPPLPSLGATLGRLLVALEVLVAPGERDRSRRLIEEFGAPGGAGPRLQERLRRQKAPPPRLPEWPWGSSERLPLPVHTSVGLVLPRQDWGDWRGQISFASRLVMGVLDYRQQLESRDPPEPWVQAAFGGCRVPGPRRDEVLRVPPSAQPPPSIIVSRNCQFFQVSLGGGVPGSPLPPAGSLGAALGALRGRAGKGGAPPVGLLTGEHRGAWGGLYGAMMRDRLNRDSIGRIQRSLLCLSLDAPVMAAGAGEVPAAQILHGGGAGANSGNRWFDKTLQFIVGEDGACGVLYDPAVIDGAVVAEMVDHALEFSRRPEVLGPAPMTSPPLPPPRPLRFSLGPEVAPGVERAKRHMESLAADVTIHCFRHPGVGDTGGLDPQDLLSVAMQAAFHGAHGSLCASCEPTPLRVLPGCSDLLRPPESPCRALAQALRDPQSPPEVQLQLLREAVKEQGERAREVRAGRGSERHLWALRSAASGEPLPQIFTDPGYTLSTHYRLCTLQVSSREGLWVLRGPLVPDGYGVGVGHEAPSPNSPPRLGGLLVAITSFSCCHQTDPPRLGGALRETLDQLGGLLRGCPPP